MTVGTRTSGASELKMREGWTSPVPGSSVPEVYRFLQRALLWLRWPTLLALLLITLAMPTRTALDFPSSTLVLVFVGYSAISGIVGHRLPALFSLSRAAILDLLVAALLYLLAVEPGGPLFILFFMAVVCGAAALTVRGILLYTGATVLVALTIDLTFLAWTPTEVDIHMLFVRAVMLTLLGAGMTIVTRRLVLEHAATQSEHDATLKLEDLDQLRANFISTASHELRTPLTAARAGLGLMEASIGTSDRLLPDEQELLSTARRNIERLTILIDDLLTFNQVQAGTLHLDHATLDLRTIVMDSLSAVYPLILEKGQTLEITLPEPLPYMGDARQLEQLVVNLLANAQRHTSSGTRITISGEATDGEILLSVSDNGPGIPPEGQEAIFQRFYRLHPGDEGSGLGLAIARSIVELHGGRMWVESELGKGASFHIALPNNVPPQIAAQSESEEGGNVEGNGVGGGEPE